MIMVDATQPARRFVEGDFRVSRAIGRTSRRDVEKRPIWSGR
jgi:hypothetical protein